DSGKYDETEGAPPDLAPPRTSGAHEDRDHGHSGADRTFVLPRPLAEDALRGHLGERRGLEVVQDGGGGRRHDVSEDARQYEVAGQPKPLPDDEGDEGDVADDVGGIAHLAGSGMSCVLADAAKRREDVV